MANTTYTTSLSAVLKDYYVPSYPITLGFEAGDSVTTTIDANGGLGITNNYSVLADKDAQAIANRKVWDMVLVGHDGFQKVMEWTGPYPQRYRLPTMNKDPQSMSYYYDVPPYSSSGTYDTTQIYTKPEYKFREFRFVGYDDNGVLRYKEI